MYNRYIPQKDGSYQKRSVQDSPQAASTNPKPAPPPQPAPHISEQKKETLGSFLRKLLPQGMDAGDLIVILLLLLIAGDSQEEHNNALLTTALYFFM